MKPYHKIQTIFKRNPVTHVLTHEYSKPEFEYLKDNTWIFTEKVDGTNIRIISHPDGNIEFRGRTNNAQIPARLVKRLIELFPHNGKLYEQFPDGACLYGEGFGAKIQKGGGNYSLTQEFVLFDILIGDWWLKRHTIEEIAKSLEINVVPIIQEGTLGDMINFTRNGFTSFWGNFQAEGIVARPKVELFTRGGDRIITKLKCKDYK